MCLASTLSLANLSILFLIVGDRFHRESLLCELRDVVDRRRSAMTSACCKVAVMVRSFRWEDISFRVGVGVIRCRDHKSTVNSCNNER